VFIKTHCCDILLLIETWLKFLDNCPYFHAIDFTIYRKDRLKVGSCTAFLIRNNIASCQVDITDENAFFIFVVLIFTRFVYLCLPASGPFRY